MEEEGTQREVEEKKNVVMVSNLNPGWDSVPTKVAF